MKYLTTAITALLITASPLALAHGDAKHPPAAKKAISSKKNGMFNIVIGSIFFSILNSIFNFHFVAGFKSYNKSIRQTFLNNFIL